MTTDNTKKGLTGTGHFCNRVYVKTWICAIMIFATLTSFPTANAVGEPQSDQSREAKTSPVSGASAGIGELINILVDKGLLKKEDMATLSEHKETPSLAVLTELLKNKGILTVTEAERVAKKTKTEKAGPVTLYYEQNPAEMEKLSQRVASELKKDFRERVKTEIKEEILDEAKKDVQNAAAPEWTKRIRFGGDIRLRYQGDYFGRSNDIVQLNPNDLTQTLNLTEDRHRLRIRARLSAKADINETTEAGLRITTGNTTNPVTANQTMGTYGKKYSIVLDQAYLKIKPLSGLAFWGGRIPNPFFHSGLVCDEELTFDAVAAGYVRPITDKIGAFLTAGVFPLEEFEFTSKDKWLYAAQIGADFKPARGLTGKLGLAYYYYKNVKGAEIDPLYPNDWQQYTASPFLQKGNTLININTTATDYTEYVMALGSDFRELNITGMFDIAFWDPIHVILSGDYVKNVGFNYKPADGSKVSKYDYGYQIGLSVGHQDIKAIGDWRIFGYYRYLGADAVIDAFADPGFHLGGTNAKGWVLGGQLGLAKNLWLSGKWATTNEIAGAPMAIDSLFLDVNARF